MSAAPGRFILEEHPAAHVTISSDVASELREFERTSTVAINASTIPDHLGLSGRTVASTEPTGAWNGNSS